MKEMVPVITAEQVAKCDTAATTQAEGTMTALVRAQSGEDVEAEEAAAEAGPKLHKHYYRKNGTCACGAVQKNRKTR